jgi:hypothetical protein
MFQVPGFALPGLCIRPGVMDSKSTRFPDSDISGSTLVASSPELIAGCRVFRRLSMPRHPPYTLSSLTTLIKDRPRTKKQEARSKKPEVSFRYQTPDSSHSPDRKSFPREKV